MSSSSVASISPSVYADLSAAAYADFWVNPNKILPSELPPNWTKINQYSQPDATAGAAALIGSGFSASTFVNATTQNIVISFEGTDFGGDSGKQWSDFISDAALGLGIGSSQLINAALLYEQVKNDPQYKNYTISFTGHSLGAGLASVIVRAQ